MGQQQCGDTHMRSSKKKHAEVTWRPPRLPGTFSAYSHCWSCWQHHNARLMTTQLGPWCSSSARQPGVSPAWRCIQLTGNYCLACPHLCGRLPSPTGLCLVWLSGQLACPRLQEHVATGFVSYNNNFLSHSSEGQKSKMVLTEMNLRC